MTDRPTLIQAKTFSYTALDPTGNRIQRTIRAESEQAVISTLHSRGLFPLEVKEKKVKFVDIQLTGKRLKGAALADFTRQLYALVNAGIPIVESIRSVARSTKNAEHQKMLLDLADKVQEGYPLSQALSRHSRSFDATYVAYIEAGEATGNMRESMERLAISLDKKVKLRRRVRSAMTYPVLVTSMITLIVSAILIFLVPQFESLYAGLGGDLPGPTKLLMNASRAMVRFWYLPVLLIGGLVYFLRSTKENIEIGMKLDKLRFKIPMLGKLFSKVALFRWAETLSGSLDAGVQSLRAVEIAATASGSRWHRYIAPEISETLRQGRRWVDILPKHSDLYPSNVQTMIETGERTGDLPEMLGRAADTLDDEVENIVSQLADTMEVALLMVMGVVVGAIMIALYLPIFQASTLING